MNHKFRYVKNLKFIFGDVYLAGIRGKGQCRHRSTEPKSRRPSSREKLAAVSQSLASSTDRKEFLLILRSSAFLVFIHRLML